VTVLSSAVADNTNQNLLNKISLNIYPNPFFNSTVIRYTIPYESKVNLKVFDVQGRRVTDLINNTQKSGLYRITWDARNTQFKKLSSGVYFLELNIDKTKLTKRVVVF
jgi:flagellar hook assembly protein FlgD